MLKIFLVLLSFSYALIVQAHDSHPLGFTELPWKSPQISRVTASLMDFHSGSLVLSWSGLGRVESVDGRDCLVGPYFLFDIDDSWAFNIDEPVSVKLELARGEGVLVSYDHSSSAPVMYAMHGVTPSSTVELVLDHARFANRIFAGSDLAIAATGAVYPFNPLAEHEITICGLTLERHTQATKVAPTSGTIQLNLVDAATASPTAARVGLFDGNGRMPLPSRDALLIRRYDEALRQLPIVTEREFWPAPGGYAFYVDGHYTAEVPVGEYELVLMKGTEYRISRHKVSIQPGKTTEITLELERWHNAPAAGWYSGDVHVHVARGKPDNPEILGQMRGEGLHVTNILQMANVVRSHFPQYAFGETGRYLENDHALVAGQEAPRSGHRGHAIGLNGARYYKPKEFFLYHKVARSLRSDGGLFGYAHLLGDAFHVARGLALDAPLGLVDFVEILQFGVLDTQLYYDMLNLGLRIAPAGGSDYPYIDLPGAARSYVHIDGAFTTEAWFEGLRQGNTFVSNGPLLQLDVNGAGMGADLHIESNESVEIRASARLNPDFDKLNRLELIVQGMVVASATSSSGAESLKINHRLTPEAGLWLAIRAYGRGIAVAHSGPVYVRLADDPATLARTLVPALVDKYIGLLDETIATMPAAHEDLEHWETGEQLATQWKKQLPELRKHAAAAREKLEEIRVMAVQ